MICIGADNGVTGPRFNKKTKRQENGCLFWTAAKNLKGYGVYHLCKVAGQTKTILAHRFAFESFNGPVPLGLEIDHTCRNRSCVNPKHLEAVTHAENLRRGLGGPRKLCLRGHSYEDRKNVYIKPSDGKRDCIKCRIIRRRRSYNLHRR